MSEHSFEVSSEVRKQEILQRTPLLAKFLGSSPEPDPKWEDTFEKQANDIEKVFVSSFRDVWLQGIDEHSLLTVLYRDENFMSVARTQENIAMKMRMMGDYVAAIGYSLGTNTEERSLFLDDICKRIEGKLHIPFDQDPNGPLHGYVATYLALGERLKELRESQKPSDTPEGLPDSIQQFLDSLEWDDDSELQV